MDIRPAFLDVSVDQTSHSDEGQTDSQDVHDAVTHSHAKPRKKQDHGNCEAVQELGEVRR